MKNSFGFLFLPLGLIAMTVGCDAKVKPPAAVPMVSYSATTPQRKAEFAKAVVEALNAFDDLYGKVTVTTEDTPEGPVVFVTGNGRAKPEAIERLLGLAAANFEFHAPGVRFVSLGESRWKFHFPGTMQVAAAGEFDLILK